MLRYNVEKVLKVELEMLRYNVDTLLKVELNTKQPIKNFNNFQFLDGSYIMILTYFHQYHSLHTAVYTASRLFEEHICQGRHWQNLDAL